MWELDYKEGWMPNNLCFWTVVLDETLESPVDCKEIKPVNPKGNQPWIFIGRAKAEAEAPVLWSPYVNSQLIGKDPDGGKDWGQEEKGATEDEMVEWHHRLNGHEFEQTLGNSEGQGSLACCSPWVTKSWTRLSNWTTTTTWDQGTWQRVVKRDLRNFIRKGLRREEGSPFLKGMLPKSLQE